MSRIKLTLFSLVAIDSTMLLQFDLTDEPSENTATKEPTRGSFDIIG